MGKEAMNTKIQEEVGHLVADLEQVARSGQEFFPRRRVASAVSNVVCSLVFGKRYDPDDPQFVDLLHRLDRQLEINMAESAKFMFFPFLRFFRTPTPLVTFNELVDVIKEIVGEAIKHHRQDFDGENIRDFADMFIQAETQADALSLNDFAWIMFDIFIAGTETTSTALTWTLLYLSKFPEIQVKCQKAIDGVIDTDRMPVPADRNRLVYVDAIMCETLRHATIVPTGLMHSNLEEPAKIEGFDCPPFTAIMYNATTVHNDPTYWKEPRKFDPERWIGADGKLLSHSTHFMPFGLGPRICLGETLAKVEYFIFLTAILHRFKIELTTPDAKLEHDKDPGFTNVCPEYKVIFESRNH